MEKVGKINRYLSILLLITFLSNLMIIPAQATIKTTLMSAGIGAVGGALFGPLAGAVVGLSGGLIGGVPGAVAGSVSGLVAGVGLGFLGEVSMPAVIGTAALGAGAFLAYKLIKDNYRYLNPNYNKNKAYVNRITSVKNGSMVIRPTSQYGISRSTHTFVPSRHTIVSTTTKIKNNLNRALFGTHTRPTRTSRVGSRTILNGKVQLPTLRFPLIDKIKAWLNRNKNRTPLAKGTVDTKLISRRGAVLRDAKDRPRISVEDAGPERTPESIGPNRKPEAIEPERKPDAIEPERKPEAKKKTKVKLLDSEKFRARQRYQVAYAKYVKLLESGKSPDDPEVRAALAAYKRAYQAYLKMKKQK